MRKQSLVSLVFSATLCITLVCTQVTESAPTPTDYESIRDLYELLLQKEAYDDQIAQAQHLMVRKSNRSPSLRLRFGKKSDPFFTAQQHYSGHPLHLAEDMAEN